MTNMSEAAWKLLMEHANYDRPLLEKCIKRAEKKYNPTTLQHILDEIWEEVDEK